MVERIDVRIPLPDGIELAAWLLLPENTEKRLPAITMAHGFGGPRHHGIEHTARRFSEAGYAVLLHDHRNFGDSGGTPRQDIDPYQQIADWRWAISYLGTRREIHEQRIGIWGFSYAGGHALVLGATDRRIKAVYAQAPTVSGYETGLRRVPAHEVRALEERFHQDERDQPNSSGKEQPLPGSSTHCGHARRLAGPMIVRPRNQGPHTPNDCFHEALRAPASSASTGGRPVAVRDRRSYGRPGALLAHQEIDGDLQPVEVELP
ncbi:alpha/beta hydrolase [Streptomyces sp. NPDC101393]|uniref:alpha/beta hydrolase n=1 Tax=Streptomyces sp. NPDC101393 TaxID=3366141 RepID=UPI00382699C6